MNNVDAEIERMLAMSDDELVAECTRNGESIAESIVWVQNIMEKVLTDLELNMNTEN